MQNIRVSNLCLSFHPMASKVIIVTGASRGIGLAVANYLLKEAHRVVAVSRSEDQLKVLKDQFPSQVEYVAADMTAPNASIQSITVPSTLSVALTEQCYRWLPQLQTLRSSPLGSSMALSSTTASFLPLHASSMPTSRSGRDSTIPTSSAPSPW